VADFVSENGEYNKFGITVLLPLSIRLRLSLNVSFNLSLNLCLNLIFNDNESWVQSFFEFQFDVGFNPTLNLGFNLFKRQCRISLLNVGLNMSYLSQYAVTCVRQNLTSWNVLS
jgi:hypothetical protein